MPARTVYVLDTSAFIIGFDRLAYEAEIYTTPEVVEELKSRGLRELWETFSNIGRVRVKSPGPSHLEAAREAAFQTGDLPKLSKADLSILALTLKFKAESLNPTLVSEDYAVQNVAKQLNINYVAAVKGIRLKVKWLIYCSSCGRSLPPNLRLEACPVCGGRLKRKALRKG